MKLTKRGVAKWLRSVKLLVVDLDGTLTDGNVLYKRYDVKDGYGLKHLKITKALITGSVGPTIVKRAKELGFDFILTGIENKKIELDRIIEKLNLKTHEVCYVGDDMNDFECITYKGILSIAVNDAVLEIKSKSKYVLHKKGGHGAIREVTDMMTGGQYIES